MSSSKAKNKIYTNKFGPKGGTPTYAGKKRLSTGRIKYIYSKSGTGTSGKSSSSGFSLVKNAIPSALKK
jgi:hypothetical protein